MSSRSCRVEEAAIIRREFASFPAGWTACSDKVTAGQLHLNTSQDQLVRSLRTVAKRYLSDRELWNLALTDELTGLLNRHAFFFLADQQLRLAARSGRCALLFFCDVDGLKRINDGFGHLAGDEALIRSALILGQTFRKSDVVARIGGDEFLALALETFEECEGTIRKRLEKKLKEANAASCRYALSMSVGVAKADPASPRSIGELMEEADQLLYQNKPRFEGGGTVAHSAFERS